MSHTSGPVPLTSDYYIEREFENDVLKTLINREWVLLLGPWQHGKTSALIRIQEKLKDYGFRCAFVDLQAMPPVVNFPELLEWFSSRAARSLGFALQARPTGHGDSILEEWLRCFIPQEGEPVVILIDEASAIRDETIRNAFFGQIRAIKTAGAAGGSGSIGPPIVFAFAGTFKPDTLVDERNSPFNVCRRIETEDLIIENVEALTRQILGRDDVDDLASTIFDEVGGQPFLVQHLLSYAKQREKDDQISAIEEEITRLMSEGSDHLGRIFRVVVQDPNLVNIASIVSENGRIQNDAANADYKFIVDIGLMRRDHSNLVYRNKLYGNIARRSPQLTSNPRVEAGLSVPFFTLGESAFDLVFDSIYREIFGAAYNGAVVAANAGSYRLALVSFGVALEALLLDWLSQRASADLATAVAAAKVKSPRWNFSRYETETDPETWRLVSMMKVAKELGGPRGPLELPDSLREMRNFVHPVVMKKNYMPEQELQPEVISAGGFIRSIMRDLRQPGTQ